ncbi:hypothetical protein ALC56_14546 [Trachymyrmex septentrionalis]|uniref:Transmembrane protein n=1 Tax=Trachymyrmex septentrionalis TaxID=34720 RepID=A0A195ETF2_9HYME|nr:hypothetical protein ALC56_14546 [Trachymyrmex septentrionalis]
MITINFLLPHHLGCTSHTNLYYAIFSKCITLFRSDSNRFYGQLSPTLFLLKKRLQSFQKQNLQHIGFILSLHKWSLSLLTNYLTVKKLFFKFNTSLCSFAAMEMLFFFAEFIYSVAYKTIIFGQMLLKINFSKKKSHSFK